MTAALDPPGARAPGADPCQSLFPPGAVVVSASEPADPARLDPAERAALRKASPKRLREFATGRGCAREALARLGVHGFPLLNDAQRAPIWPEGFVGSITHCAGYCGVVVASREIARSVGLDAEAAAPLEPALAERICTPDELRRLGALPATPGLDWAKLTFSAKESFYKCYFPLARTVLGFRDVEIEFAAADARFTARLVRASAPAATEVRAFQGRFRFDRDVVFTGVALPAVDPTQHRPAG
jgi:4'-phosphopantetheinyl transferase EntD